MNSEPQATGATSAGERIALLDVLRGFALYGVFLGYAGLVAVAVHRGWLSALQRGLACVGRTALTNYIAQSVLMNLMFYWFGLNLYGELNGLEVMGLVTLLFAAQVLASVAWLSRFRMGPLEWAWRRATYERSA